MLCHPHLKQLNLHILPGERTQKRNVGIRYFRASPSFPPLFRTEASRITQLTPNRSGKAALYYKPPCPFLPLCPHWPPLSLSSSPPPSQEEPHSHVERFLRLHHLFFGTVADQSVAVREVQVECDQGPVLHAQSPQGGAVDLRAGNIRSLQPPPLFPTHLQLPHAASPAAPARGPLTWGVRFFRTRQLVILPELLSPQLEPSKAGKGAKLHLRRSSAVLSIRPAESSCLFPSVVVLPQMFRQYCEPHWGALRVLKGCI